MSQTTRRSILVASTVAAAASLTPGALRASQADDAIRPFKIKVPDEALVDLRRRVRATQWPEQETVPDATQGVNLVTMKQLAQVLAERLRLAEDRSQVERLSAIHYQHRRSGYSFHPRPFQSCERFAGHHHTRLARIGHRATENHRSSHRSDPVWRQRGGRV